MKVDAIFHLADIHIRILTRHTEYRSAYKKLFKKAREIKKKYNNPIVVIAGDIVHAKINMSPELIQMINELMEGISNILPTYVYPGNHDANLNNPSRMDALESILNMISKYNDLKYIKNAEVLEFDNLRIHHMSVFDEVSSYVAGTELINDKLNFVVYHGAVNNSYTDQNYQLTSNRITTELFDNYDGVLLGDIHKRQCLQERSNGKPEIWYPGSFVQQNHGESLHNHGGLIWKIQDNKFEVEEWNIDHDYGYVTIPVLNGNYDISNIEIPKKPRIRLKVDSTSISQLKKIKSELRQKYKVQDIQIAKDKSSVIMEESQNKIELGNMHDVEYQNQLLEEYIANNFPNDYDVKLIDKIFNINRDINKQVGVTKAIRNTVWKPISIEFDNTFSYGTGNIINFTKLEGVYGLFAPNASGKSSLLDSILFALFDRTSRTNKVSDIMNIQKNTLYTKFVFELHEQTYVIERKGKRNNHTAKLDVDFYTFNSNGDKVSLNGTDRKDTNRIIKSYIGTYDDFIMTTFSLQNSGTNFIEMKQSDRKYTLNQFLDTLIFDNLNKTARDEAKELSGYIRKEKRNDYDVKLSESKNQYDKLESSLTKLNLERDTLKSNLDNNINLITNLISKKHNIPTTMTDIKSTENLIENYKSKLDQIILDRDSINNKWLIVSESYAQIKQEYNEYNSNIEAEYKELVNFKSQLTTINHKIKNVEASIKSKEDIVTHLNEHKYNPDCNICVENNISTVEKTAKINSELNELKIKLSTLNADKTAINRSILQRQKIDETYSQYQEIKDIYVNKQAIFFNLKDEQNVLNSKESKIKVEIESSQKLLDVAYKTINQARENKSLDIQIEKIKLENVSLNNDLKLLEDEIYRDNQQIGFYKKQIEDIEEKIEQLHTAEMEYAIYEIYIKSVSRDGIPKFIIEQALPKIESEINRILNQLVEFNIVFSINGNDIETYIVYDDDRFWSLNLSSGMEKFISSLAIRVALINITSLPKPNFIAIDEGWGSLSKENLDNIFMLFDYLKSEFETTLVISHLESMRDIVDGLVEINKINKVSKVKVI